MKYAIALNAFIFICVLAVVFFLRQPLGLLALAFLKEMPYGLLEKTEDPEARGQMMSFVDTNDRDEYEDKKSRK